MCSTTRNTRSTKKRTADVYDDMPVALPAAKRPHGSPRAAARRILKANKSPPRSSTSRATSSRSSSGTATSVGRDKKRRASAVVVDYDKDDVPRSTKRSCVTDLRDATLDILDRITKGEKKLTSLTKDDLEACIYRCVQDIAIANRKDVRRIAKAYDVSTDDVDKVLEPLETKAKVAAIMADDEDEDEAATTPSPATSNKKRAAATVVDDYDYDYDYDDDVAPRAGKRICTEEQRIRNLTRDALNISSIHPKDKVDEALARTVKEGVPVANPKDVDVVAEAYDLPRNTVMEKLEDVEDVARNNVMRQERLSPARRPSVRPVAQAAVPSTTRNAEVVDLTDEPRPSPYPVPIGAPRGVLGAFIRVSEDTAIANNADVKLLMDYFFIEDSMNLLAFVDRCMALRRERARLRAAAGARAVPKRSFTTSPTGNRTKKPKHKFDLLGNLFFSAAVVNARHQGLNCTTTATLACTFLVGLYRENRLNNKK